MVRGRGSIDETDLENTRWKLNGDGSACTNLTLTIRDGCLGDYERTEISESIKTKGTYSYYVLAEVGGMFTTKRRREVEVGLGER